jgi:hypothetical protein
MAELVTFIPLLEAKTRRRLGRYCPQTGELVLFYRQRESRYNLYDLAVKFGQTPPACEDGADMLQSETAKS